ncbi:MAG TPA: bifunctional UDP-4-keto-pentose/UDP-xylose synthase [Thermoanaerobaculia bacterium]|nr:bifunctional UDP-4-keto-pentose/UDP-xylose synthase [Thermoanaerobaculia bacterium]
MARILSLGAGGFIGAHLTERLLEAGHDVTAVDIHSDKLEDLLGHPRLAFHERSIADRSFDLDAVVAKADVVIDLVAHANPGIYVRNPLDVFRLNFQENLRIAETCVHRGRRLIQFSSCEVYGKTPVAVLGDRLPDPDNPVYATFAEDSTDLIMGPVGRHRWIYACAKQLLERVLHAYGLEGRLNYTIVRPFNFIGPKIDYLPADTDGVPRVFSFFMEALLDGKPMRLVDGGRQRRCYTYIRDAVECVARIVENPGGACDRQVFNVGSPRNETSIRELAFLMRDLYQEHFAPEGETQPAPVDVPAREFYGEGYEDSDRRIPDIRKAERLLGWHPRTTLAEMLVPTMEYYVRARRRRCAPSDVSAVGPGDFPGEPPPG